MQNVNLNSLRVFSVAARNRNFQRAAQELNISHGAVSQRIRQLETELGATLFNRKSRGVALTKIGERFAISVEAALQDLAEATSKFRRKSKGVILHVSPSVASKWLMPRLPKLTAENPGICISTEAKEVVLNRSFSLNEAAIRHAKSFQPVRGQDHRCLTELRLVAVCSPALKRQMGPVGVPELLEMPLIQDSHCRWDRLAGKLNTAPAQEIMSFNRTALAIDAAINLQGVAMVPKVLAEQDIRLGNLIVIWEDPEPSGEYLFLIWHKQLTRNTSIMKVVEWILSEFKIAPQ